MMPLWLAWGIVGFVVLLVALAFSTTEEGREGCLILAIVGLVLWAIGSLLVTYMPAPQESLPESARSE